MNLRTLLILTSWITVMVPTALTTVSCGQPYTKGNSEDQEINNDIDKEQNLSEYILVKSETEGTINVWSTLTAKATGIPAILQQDGKLPKFYNPEKLKIDNIYDKDNNKIPKAMTINKTQSFQFDFDYDQVKSDGTKVKIDLTLNYKKAIVNAIQQAGNDGKYIIKDLTTQCKVKDVFNEINPNFIQKQLTNNIKANFELSKWILNDITYNDQSLTPSALQVAKAIQCKICFSYDGTNNLTTNLKIDVQQYHYNDSEIQDQIKIGLQRHPFLPTSVNTAQSRNQGNASVVSWIKQNKESSIVSTLPEDAQAIFDFTKLGIDKNIYQSPTLDSANYVSETFYQTPNPEQTTVYFYLVYNKNGDTSAKDGIFIPLKLTINCDALFIANQISQVTDYQIQVNSGSETTAAFDAITDALIKSKLSPIAKANYKPSYFNVIAVEFNNQPLTKQDLAVATTKPLLCTFNFTYDNNKGTAKIAITVKQTPYSDVQIQDTLSKIFQTSQLENTIDTAQSRDKGNAMLVSWIKQQQVTKIKALLPLDMQAIFINTKLGVDSNIYQTPALGSKNYVSTTFYQQPVAKQVVYAYVVYNEKADPTKTDGVFIPINLTINYDDQFMVNQITKVTDYQIQVKKGSETIVALSAINSNLIKSKLSSDVQNKFVITKFNVKMIELNNQPLTKKDLAVTTTKPLLCTFNFTYGDISGTGSIAITVQ